MTMTLPLRASTGTVTAAVTTAQRTIAFEDRPEPVASPGTAVIKMHSVTLCGTDAHIWDDDYASELPIVQGHEASGTIVALDPADEGSGFAVGDRVVICPMFYCGTCYACSVGRVNACSNMTVYGCYQDGSLTQRQAVPLANLYRLPASLSLDLAPLVEPISIAMQACKRGRPVAGENVQINGAGPIGLLALAYLKDIGCNVSVTDMNPQRLEIASRFGADRVFTVEGRFPTPAQADQVAEWTNGNGPSLVIDATGVPASLAAAIDVVSTAGRVVCVGISDKPLTFDMRTLVTKEIDILGSRNSQNLFPECIDLLDRYQDMLATLITHRFGFHDLDAAFHAMADPGAGKIAIDFSEPGSDSSGDVAAVSTAVSAGPAADEAGER